MVLLPSYFIAVLAAHTHLIKSIACVKVGSTTSLRTLMLRQVQRVILWYHFRLHHVHTRTMLSKTEELTRACPELQLVWKTHHL